MEKKSFAQEYEIIGAFLVLELIALISFGFGGITSIFQYAGFIISLIATYFAFRNFSKDDVVPLLIVGVPLLLMSIFTSFGHSFDGNSLLNRLGAFLGIISFLAVGLSARRIKSLNINNLVLCLAIGLGLVTLIGTFSTWVQYGFFYPLIHKEAPNYYYNGELYSIANEMSWLWNFKILEVTQNFGGLFAVLSASFLPALLFIKYKDNKVMFVALLSVSVIGLLSIITIPNVYAIIFIAISYGVALFYRFLRNNNVAIKIVRTAIPALFGIVIVFFVVAILNLSVTGIGDTIANNAFLNRIFNNNGLAVELNSILGPALKSSNLFGIHRYDFTNQVIYSSTRSFEIEILREGGLIALILFIIFLVIAFESFSRYLKDSKDKDFIKVIFLTLLVTYVLYNSLCADVRPFTHAKSSYYEPITRSTPFLIMIFIIGFTILPKGKGEIEFKDSEPKKIDNNQRYIDDEYAFNDVEEEELI